MLLDRLTERAALSRLLQVARGGRSAVLLVHGEVGMGKTALLEDAIASAAGMRVARVAGIESEMELPYAALQQLCAPMLDGLDRLPDPQREALGVVFGLRAGEPPDRFLVGLAALSLLADAAQEQPLLCVIDDAQWLDQASAQALGVVARRLLGEPVALVVAEREPSAEFRGLPELLVGGLGDRHARDLISTVISGRLDEQVLERFIAETGGNPLALLELPRGLTANVNVGFDVVPAAGVLVRLEDTFRRRLEALSQPARRLLLVAAADPTGDPVLLWRAAGLLGIGMEAAIAAEEEGLLTIGQRVIFRHPLVRWASYQAASTAERQSVHQALATATDAQADPDRRAWHRAQAAAGPDEDIAFELERSAGRAQARGGFAAAGAFLERSANLTPSTTLRAERALAAAHAKYQAGALDAALGLLAAAEAGPLDELQRARSELLRGQIAFSSSRGSDAPPVLVKAARRFEPLDPRLAREAYLRALLAALFASSTPSVDLLEVAAAARAAPLPPQPPRPADLLLDGIAVHITDGYEAGAPMLARAVSAFRGGDISPEEELRWLWPACHCAGLVWDFDSWQALSDRRIQLARDAGAVAALPLAFNMRAMAHLFAGEFTATTSLVAQLESVSHAIGVSPARYTALALAVFLGREAEAAELIATVTTDSQRRGEGAWLPFVHWATAVLCNSLGQYEKALGAAEQGSQGDSVAGPHWAPKWAAAELIEAAVRNEQHERAADALERLSLTTRASRTDWARGIEARSRALVSQGKNADACFREAIDCLGRTQLRVELARAHLLYGEWLRRQRRIRDARGQLRRAHTLFTGFGMEAFAERARIELRATGAQALKRTDAGTPDVLTAQEALIARRASEGASNAQIAAQLFISPATVAYHLSKVFAKLGISSRSQLAPTLPTQPDAAKAAAPPG